jgi:hypothetical protein
VSGELVVAVAAMGYTVTGERARNGRNFVRVTHAAFPGWRSAWVPLTASGVDGLRVALAVYGGVAVGAERSIREAALRDALTRELEAVERRRSELMVALEAVAS